jgi:apolipoprotein N-acyltransferase
LKGCVRTAARNKSFAELFQKRPSAPAGATAFFFFMSFFFLCLYWQKEKAGFFLTSYKITVN